MANQVAVYKARFLEFKKISGFGYLKPMFAMCSGCLITRLRSELIIRKASAHLGIGSGMNGLFGASPARRGRLEGAGPSSNVGASPREGGITGIESCWDCCWDPTDCKTANTVE